MGRHSRRPLRILSNQTAKFGPVEQFLQAGFDVDQPQGFASLIQLVRQIPDQFNPGDIERRGMRQVQDDHLRRRPLGLANCLVMDPGSVDETDRHQRFQDQLLPRVG